MRWKLKCKDDGLCYQVKLKCKVGSDLILVEIKMKEEYDIS